jgi:hypothetical protein
MRYYFDKETGRCCGYNNINSTMHFFKEIPIELQVVPYDFLFYNFETESIYIDGNNHPYLEYVNGVSRYKAELLRELCIPKINKLKEYYLAGGVYYNNNWISTSNNALIEYLYFYTNYKSDALSNNDIISFAGNPIIWTTLTRIKINLTYGDLQNIISLIFQLRILVQAAYEKHMTFLEDITQYPGEDYDFYANWPIVCPGVIPQNL